MSTHKLIFEEQDEVELIALRTSEPAYKVVWRLNQKLGVSLRKIGEYKLERPQGTTRQGLFDVEINEPSYEVFSLNKEDAENEALVLVSNKDEGTELFTEARGFDMVLFVASQTHDIEVLQEVLDELEGTLTTQLISCSSYARFITPFNYFDL